MSIIQQIREKAAWLVFGLIALSLIGFLLMDAFVGRSRLFGNRSTTVGTVNGEKIEYNDFQRLVSLQEEQYKRSGYPMNEGMQQNIREGVWRQMIEDALLTGDENTLGLEVTDKEINDMLVGANAIQDIKRAFTDPKTGVFDAQAAAARINQMRQLWKAGPKKNADNREYEAARSFFEESVPQIAKMRLREKYTSLLANSAFVPKWMLEKGNADNSQLASISYVNTPYFTIPDSAVKVSESEIADYVNEHKDQFHQEEGRSIAYVVFDASPNAADSAALRQQLTDMKADFAKSDKPEAFLARMGSEQQYFDGYKGKSQIMVPNKDSIFALAKGQVYGPYLDAGSYVLAKKIDEKLMPDSVKARHVLVATADRNGQTLLPDSVAKARIDSVKNLLEHGISWDTVALKYSDDGGGPDGGSKAKGGDLGYFANGQMVKEFNDFSFEGKKGDAKIVKTQFGYHYVQIVDQKNIEPAYKIAYLSKRIEASNETDQRVSGMASQFAGENHDPKAFDQAIQKNNYQKLLAPDIQPSEFSIPGVGASRSLVRWIYEGKLGDVSEPFPVGDKYIVAEITEINAEGLMSAAKARGQVEPILRNKKKAEIIMKKLGTPASLEAAAASAGAGQSVQRADSVLFSSPMIPNAGQEPKVIGSAFNKALAGKPASPPIAGNGGVFVIKVENVSATSNLNADLQQQRFMQEQQQKSRIFGTLMESLRKQAKVKDDRGKFY
ncbi:SurA N-terminal domain-containing protein [Flavitalea sp. BT771]|uniref:peptidylprolyl isomerase n=1 Tax=Flavitalea sp. BT771 TaxID=3063329 RepID=UPI0026E3669A|nr:peptidylprolyl isomerase [Flavitalea sp. BT771]MDO6433347.1 SurA N-terminal domain-containing protein [Flavitalea sp. BT771]MDV6222748.1 peptidylprolyl isomerase [Flavitalea sp. BT771]